MDRCKRSRVINAHDPGYDSWFWLYVQASPSAQQEAALGWSDTLNTDQAVLLHLSPTTQRELFDVPQIVRTSAFFFFLNCISAIGKWPLGLLLLQKLFKEETFEELKHIFYAFIRVWRSASVWSLKPVKCGSQFSFGAWSGVRGVLMEAVMLFCIWNEMPVSIWQGPYEERNNRCVTPSLLISSTSCTYSPLSN